MVGSRNTLWNLLPWLALWLLLPLLAGCLDGEKAVTPSVYLLNHQQWTPSLVLNFADEVAPFDGIGNTLQVPPKLDPPMDGEWRWQDPSRLVFFPSSKTIGPDSRLSLSLRGVKLRAGYRLKDTLTYQTPTLSIMRLECRWQETSDAPLRRSLDALVEFNYPVKNPLVHAEMGKNIEVPLNSGAGTRIGVSSGAMLRPDQDSSLRVEVQPGPLELMERDTNQNAPGPHVKLDRGASCELPVLRSAWDKIDEEVKRPPTVTEIHMNQVDEKLTVSLRGYDLSESAKKLAAGQPVKGGVSLDSSIKGTWIYGDAAAGPDLIFTPAEGQALTPGTSYGVTVAAEAFPGLIFAQPQFSSTFTTWGMSGNVVNVQLYSDPLDPKIKRITATLAFNYPPQRDLLPAKTTVRLRVEPAKTFEDNRIKQIPFELAYDEKNPRLAYLKTVPIQIPDEPGEVKVTLEKGLVSSLKGAPSTDDAQNSVALPSAENYLKVTELETHSVIQDDGDVEHLLTLRTTVPLKQPALLGKSVQAYLLPDCREENPDRLPLCKAKEVIEWQSADQVDTETLKLAQAMPVGWRETAEDDKTLHYLSLAAPEQRQLLVKVNQGLESVDDFRLAKDARFLIETGKYQRELKILHDGALLSLTGTKQLGVAVRGVSQVHVQLQRVLPHNMHHLARFTRGEFQRPSFNLPIEHFAETFDYDETLPAGKEMARQYFAVDFARFTRDKGFPPRGLFLLTVAEKKDEKPNASEPCSDGDPADCADTNADADGGEADAEGEGGEGNESEVNKDRRLVLLTDMGLLVKTGNDGRQNLYVMSFRSGKPIAGAQISLLGTNGVPVFSGKTDEQGHASFPSTEGLKAEKAPTVYLAEKDGDVAFLPYSRDTRLMDVSRFDVDGLRDTAESLHAYLFSDRGIYRPGDTVHVGMILRKRDWSALPGGLPLKAVITDPEEQEVWSKTLAFGSEGFEEITWPTPEGGKTGTYRIELFVAEKQKKSLGSATVRVEEFQPDRLQVKTEIIDAPPNGKGWLSPQAAKARVSVRNLFGTAAAGNQAKLEMTVRPWSGQIAGFPDYRFRGTVEANIPDQPRELGELTTDAHGEAAFDLPLADITEPVYEIALAGEGFEKDSGRSVVTVASSLVSRQPFLLGLAADGSLDYVSKGSARQLKLLALGPDFQPAGAGTLSAEIYESRYVSTLVKREDGLYAYQSVERKELHKTEPISLSGGKANLTLPSENPGSFFVVFKDAQGEELNKVFYSVAGEGNVSRNIERNAELNLKLNKKEYQPGEEIEVHIVAPYQGAGLITIEQDKVLTHQWINTRTTASTHRITLPKGTSGNAYLSVAFVRSLDSKEIYMSPLSYGVLPFAISRQAYTQDVSLTVPESVQPGSNLEVSYRVKDPTKLVLYAVDEGILQFAHYRNPGPLDHFFRKRALQIKTHQILDLILPDYALAQKLAAPGGDEDAETFGKYKNPFARKHKPPLAFWSGIIEAAPGEHMQSIPVPDYFNGGIRVLAVAANASKLAVPSGRSVARNPFVIQPQQPYAVAPGDEFDMGVLVANATGDAGDQTLEVSVGADDALELISPNRQKLTLAPGRDGTVRFRAKAKPRLGATTVRYRVTGGGREAGYSEEMTIRPSQPLLTTMQNGVLRIDAQRKGKSRTLDLQRTLYAEQRQAELAISMTPSAYLRGIVEFLKNYPYGCTEQVVSQAFPAVVLGANPELGLSGKDVDRLLSRALQILQTRQKHDGSFGYWSVGDAGNPVYSMYATHLLLEARERGRKISDTMLEQALHFADQYSQERHYSWPEHEAEAYGLYLLARNGQTVTDRLRFFEAELERQWGQAGASAGWVRFFLGAAYKLHHLDGDADRFFGEFQRQWKSTGLLPWDIQQNPAAMSLYLYLVNRHLPEMIDTEDPQFGRYLLELAQDLVKQRISSFRGSLALLGLGSLWQRFDQAQEQSYHVLAGTPPKPLTLEGKTVKRALLEPTTRPLELRGDGTWNLYYQLSERGYDQAPPTEAMHQGIAINRQLLNEKGEKVDQLSLENKLHIRFALHPDRAMKDVAVVMLMPGGFEIDLSEEGLGTRQSLKVADKPLWQPDYIDVQEDRVVFFGALDSGEKYFEFRIKPLNTGTYTVPPVMAEGMYDTEIQYRGLAESIVVKE